MMERILADESLKFLVFLGVPITLLLIGFLIYVAMRPSFYRATFPAFSVEVFNLYRNNFGLEEGFIELRDGKRRVKFPTQFPLNGPIRVQTPEGTPEDDLPLLVSKVSQGLKKMRRKYVIYRKLDPLPVPQEKRDAAKAELSSMGIDAETGGQNQSPVMPNWKRLGGKAELDRLARIQDLMRTAEGSQEHIEVLAGSE